MSSVSSESETDSSQDSVKNKPLKKVTKAAKIPLKTEPVIEPPLKELKTKSESESEQPEEANNSAGSDPDPDSDLIKRKSDDKA